jgi:hypothetical protein
MLKIEDITLIPIDNIGEYMEGCTYLFKLIRNSDKFEMEFLFWQSKNEKIKSSVTILPIYYNDIGWSDLNKPQKNVLIDECNKLINNANK